MRLILAIQFRLKKWVEERERRYQAEIARDILQSLPENASFEHVVNARRMLDKLTTPRNK